MEKKGQTGLLDLSGSITHVPITRKTVLSVLLAVLLFFAGKLLPLDSYGNKAAAALGFFMAIVSLMFTQPWHIFITGMLVPVLGFFLGFWDWATFQTASGTSVFVQVLGITIVAMGAETTSIGKRIAYWFLNTFGQKPLGLICAFSAVTGILSAFVSDTAVLIMMSSIANSLLLAMGEKPGESGIGKCLMLLVPVMALIGGTGLYCGCILANAFGLSLIKAAAGEMFSNFELSFGQWALMGFPSFVLTCIPISLIYAASCRINSKNCRVMPKEYYAQLSASLGKISGAEIRWIITVVAMVITLLCGVNTNATALLFAAITLLPLIGTVPSDKVMNLLPLKIFFVVFFTAIYSSLFTGTGLSNMFGDLMAPLFTAMSPYWFSVVVFLIMAFLTNALINGNIPAMSLVFAVSAPICIKLGYNPFVVLFPAITAASFFFWIPLNANMLLNKGYGWWDVKDAILPAAATLVLLGLVTPAVSIAMAPLAGLSVYL